MGKMTSEQRPKGREEGRPALLKGREKHKVKTLRQKDIWRIRISKRRPAPQSRKVKERRMASMR